MDARLGGGETHLPEVFWSGWRDVQKPVPGTRRQLLLLVLLWEMSVVLLNKRLALKHQRKMKVLISCVEQTYGLTLPAGGSLQLPPLILPADHSHVCKRWTSAQKTSNVRIPTGGEDRRAAGAEPSLLSFGSGPLAHRGLVRIFSCGFKQTQPSVILEEILEFFTHESVSEPKSAEL